MVEEKMRKLYAKFDCKKSEGYSTVNREANDKLGTATKHHCYENNKQRVR